MERGGCQQGCCITAVAQSLRTLDNSVEHACVIPTMGLDAEMIVGIYQPRLWLFVHQASYPSAHWMRAVIVFAL